MHLLLLDYAALVPRFFFFSCWDSLLTGGCGKYLVRPGSGTGSARAFRGGGNGGLGFARQISPRNSSVALARVQVRSDFRDCLPFSFSMVGIFWRESSQVETDLVDMITCSVEFR